ncbi:MAG TPA: ATP-binding cassette domain-containing protein [Accumulibacter sp.]|jgi:ABC-2 type transport system ATP-binding protein|nr:ATP-binding cassette domain-containing protein [Accumulibacter sp.]
MSRIELTVEATDVVKRFKGANGGPALNTISIAIPKGQLTALVGPDGAGKTTLIRLIAGLMKPDSGMLRTLGIDVASNPQAVQDLISYMPQKFGLYEDLSVMENLNLYADLHGVSMDERKERFNRMLAMTDMAAFTGRLAGNLSGGMKQKLGLACTLVRSPRLLLLDEPTVGVDPLSRRELWRIVQQLVEEEGLPVVVSTAYLDEAERCAHVIVMTEGKILAEGTPADLCGLAKERCFIAYPPTGVLARTLQACLIDDRANVLDAVPESGAVRFIRAKDTQTSDLDSALQGVRCEATPARLEDGVMTLLREKNAQINFVQPRRQQNLQARAGAGSDSAELIQVRDLVRWFGEFTAVASTSFSVRRGEIFGLLGPNGAGKTTTFRMLCGLLPATSGFLEVAGFNLRTARAAARARIGYVSQKFALYENLSVVENLTFFGGAYGLDGSELKSRIDHALNEFELQTKKDERSGNLPGGFKQRLAMATALIHRPEILFLDEPTSGIDPLARRAFWRRITTLAAEGTTIIVTTHFMEEAEYCDRIVIQDAGRLLALGTPHEVRTQASGAANMNDAFLAIIEKGRQNRQASAMPVDASI